MNYNMPKKYSHWAYRRENEGHLAEIRRKMEESKDFPSGWKKVAERSLGSLLPHEIMLYDGETIFRGRRYRVLFLETWYYHNANELYTVDRLFAELDPIPSDEPLDIEKVVLRLNWGIDRSEEELEQCKKWLLEYQAANQLTLRELDERCFNDPVWMFEQIFG